MIVIKNTDDLSKLKNTHLKNYIKSLLLRIFDEYQVECVDEQIGTIYYIETIEELKNGMNFGLTKRLTESRFEMIEEIGDGFSHGIIVVTNEYVISIFAPSFLFKELL